jgi:hypothetical protein
MLFVWMAKCVLVTYLLSTTRRYKVLTNRLDATATAGADVSSPDAAKHTQYAQHSAVSYHFAPHTVETIRQLGNWQCTDLLPQSVPRCFAQRGSLYQGAVCVDSDT